jgi:hypothetical protein
VKYLYSLLLLSFVLTLACKKSNDKPDIIAIVAGKGPGTVIAAWVENPDPNVYSFLCNGPGVSSYMPYYNCGNAIYLRNLPANLQDSGTKIRISGGWKDYGQPMLFSSINHAHELEIKKVTRAE